MDIIPRKKELSKGTQDRIVKTRSFFQDSLIYWGKRNYRPFPWRKNRTPYNVFICEILLRRTTAQSVSKFYPLFLEQYPCIGSLYVAKQKSLSKLIKSIGYHNQRAVILKKAAEFITTYHNGTIPHTFDELMDIPQVGYYITNCVLTFGFGIPTSIVDTNVDRILRRVYSELNNFTTLRLTRLVADQLAPVDENQIYNYALLDLGGIVCKSSSPKCTECPLKTICDYFIN